jgi:hypothetical protein
MSAKEMNNPRANWEDELSMPGESVPAPVRGYGQSHRRAVQNTRRHVGSSDSRVAFKVQNHPNRAAGAIPIEEFGLPEVGYLRRSRIPPRTSKF